MVDIMKGITKTIRSMALEPLHGLIRDNIQVDGKMGNRMAKDAILELMELKKRGFGKMENVLDG